MRALILAGGAGRRLAGEPKSLLRFGTSRLVQLQLRLLRAAGFRHPLIVTDRRALEIADLVGRQAWVVDTHGMGSRQGLLMGLLLARAEPVLVVHGDVLAPARVFAELKEDQAVVLRPRGEGKVAAQVGPASEGEGLRLWALGEGEWQYGGVLALSGDSVRLALSLLAASTAQDYWEALNPLFREREILAIPHSHDYFVDIDTAQDSLRAHRDVWPRLAAGG